MALQEYYNTGDDSSGEINSSTYRRAQTFTTESEYDIYSVKLKLYRIGSPGTATVRIEETTDSKPNGSVIATATYSMDSITSDSDGAWYEIVFDSSATLSNTTMYAIVVFCSTADGSNQIRWRGDQTSPTYTGGTHCYSSNSGSSWSTLVTADFMFECHSEGTPVYGTCTIAASSGLSASGGTVTYKYGVCTIAAASAVAGAGGVGSITGEVEANWRTDTFGNIKRLVVFSSDSLYYEDLD